MNSTSSGCAPIAKTRFAELIIYREILHTSKIMMKYARVCEFQLAAALFRQRRMYNSSGFNSKYGDEAMLKIFNDKKSLSKAAAVHAASSIREAIATNGRARIVLATGAAAFDFLEFLSHEPGIDWSKVEAFHLDEYIGLPITHPASFRKILQERIVQKAGIGKFHPLDGEHDAEAVVEQVSKEIASAPIDVAFVGIGENGHLAFNDPPADFETEKPYIIVNLDEACRRQQIGEGWFHTLADVPRRAISMTIYQILRANEILCVVPDARKADAVAKCLQSEITPLAPASILRTHPNTFLYLDADSSAQLRTETLAALA